MLVKIKIIIYSTRYNGIFQREILIWNKTAYMKTIIEFAVVHIGLSELPKAATGI